MANQDDVAKQQQAIQSRQDQRDRSMQKEQGQEPVQTGINEPAPPMRSPHPGPVWTPLNPADKSTDEIKEFGASTTFKRPAQPEELSPAYVFLASPACSSYITGIILPITGTVGE